MKDAGDKDSVRLREIENYMLAVLVAAQFRCEPIAGSADPWLSCQNLQAIAKA